MLDYAILSITLSVTSTEKLHQVMCNSLSQLTCRELSKSQRSVRHYSWCHQWALRPKFRQEREIFSCIEQMDSRIAWPYSGSLFLQLNPQRFKWFKFGALFMVDVIKDVSIYRSVSVIWNILDISSFCISAAEGRSRSKTVFCKGEHREPKPPSSRASIPLSCMSQFSLQSIIISKSSFVMIGDVVRCQIRIF